MPVCYKWPEIMKWNLTQFDQGGIITLMGKVVMANVKSPFSEKIKCPKNAQKVSKTRQGGGFWAVSAVVLKIKKPENGLISQ